MFSASERSDSQPFVERQNKAPILAAQPADAAKFVAHEMNANFVTNLQSDHDAIIAANKQLEKDREGGVGSTASITPLIQQGTQLVTTLNAIMHNKYQSQPDKLAERMSASHVERDPQRAGPTPPPAAPTK
jgi:hypothetical protein